MSKCYAVQHSDEMVCERCRQSWDVNDRFEPECKPEAERTKEVQRPGSK